MTRKHFAAIADAVRETKERNANLSDPVARAAAEIAIAQTAAALASACRSFSPSSFSRQRFMDACGF